MTEFAMDFAAVAFALLAVALVFHGIVMLRLAAVLKDWRLGIPAAPQIRPPLGYPDPGPALNRALRKSTQPSWAAAGDRPARR